MRKASLALFCLVMSCARAPLAERAQDLHSSLPLPASRDEQLNGSVKPPGVLRSGPETADYSYATGCYHAYERICGKLLTDAQRDVCREDGLDVCEKYAHEFGEWIRSGAVAPRK